MKTKELLSFALAASAFFALVSAAPAQTGDGELTFRILDQTGLPLDASVEIECAAASVHRSLPAPAGAAVFRRLPYGVYSYDVKREGFSGYSGLVEVRSPLPLRLKVTLGVGVIETVLAVEVGATLLDPRRIGSSSDIGSRRIAEAMRVTGRTLPDLLAMQPGWILEAGGVLHPRGSEYQVQYLVDGLPLLDNRSPSYAPPFEADNVQSMRALTGSYPAEFGRKLGGVIQIDTAPDKRAGFHGKSVTGGGSFGSFSEHFGGQYGWGSNLFGGSLEGGRTNRYLDPPVIANFTNSVTAVSASSRFERDITDNDRFSLSLSRGEVRFQVPNELHQQAAGQRQDRATTHFELQGRYQRVLSPSMLFAARGMYQDLDASLWSNSFSVPIAAQQDRGFRLGNLGGSLAGNHGRHSWKVGGDFLRGPIRERFQYEITDLDEYESSTPIAFLFAARARDRESSLFIDDTFNLGDFTVRAGLRWDSYSLLLNERAVSPRVGASYFVRGAGILVHASYDRVFQTPAVENLLLASSPELTGLSDDAVRLPLRPSRGNFYEIGASRAIAGRMRLDVNLFRRDLSNFEDDDLLLNTGVAFPITFSRARIHGIEARLELPQWGPVSAALGYANQSGVAWLPVTGGLFLDEGDADLLLSSHRFAISQDQRNTASALLRFQIVRGAWLASSARYGSGLPVEVEGEQPDLNELREQYEPRILDRVNFARNRVRPSFTLDFSGGITLWESDRRRAAIQADLGNVTNRFNLINFAGLLSGTAIAAPRSLAVRLTLDF